MDHRTLQFLCLLIIRQRSLASCQVEIARRTVTCSFREEDFTAADSKKRDKKHVKFKSFQGQGSGPAAATTLDVAMEKCVLTIKQIIIIGFGCQGGIIASAKLKGAFMGQE